MTASTIPAFKSALKTALEGHADVGVAGVLVVWGDPTPAQKAERAFVLMLTADGEQEPGSLGALKRDEEYDQTLLISVLYEGDQQQQAEERAWAIADGVQAAIAADMTLGGVVREAQLVGRVRGESFSDGNRSEGRVFVTVRGKARI